MPYRKMSVPGAHITWNNNVFPTYPTTSGPRVSQRRINRLKPVVKALLEEEEIRITKAFAQFAHKRHPGARVQLDLKGAAERVDNTSVCHDESLYGESDGERIWIAKEKVNDAYLLGTMLHEALHYAARINNKYICEEDEHRVFRALGDDC